MKKTIPLLFLSALLLVGCQANQNGQGGGGDNPPGNYAWKQVTSIEDLFDGATVTIGNIASKAVIGELFSNTSQTVTAFSSVTCNLSDLSNISGTALTLTLGVSNNHYTFKNSSNQLLGATAVKKLAWGSGVTTWDISIDDSYNALISNSNADYGKFLFNTTSPRFGTYTTSATSTMVLPQMFVYASNDPIPVTGVSLLETTKTLGVGRTYQITPKFTPSNATNKEVRYSSNNNHVSVSSTGLVTANSVGTSVVTVTTVDGGYTATCTITVEEIASDAWTIMIYMCGADLESNGSTKASSATGLASSDIDEILSVSGQPDDVNIIIETGGAKVWQSGHSYSISNSKLERWHVENKQLVKDDSLTYSGMNYSSTFQSFLEWGLTEYPAEKTGVILWNHGGGMYGVCYDEKIGQGDDALYASEINTAVKNAFSKTGTSKLEWIGYDACLMAVQDIAEMNSSHFNYMVCAQESEAGEGWDYDNWVDDLYAKKSTEVILKAIVDSFIADNGGASATTYQGYTADQTLSVIKLSKMAAYKTAWENMATQLRSKLNSSNRSAFNKAIVNNVKKFADDSDNSYEYFCTFDAKDFLNKLASNSAFSNYRIDASYTTAAINAFNDAVLYSVAQKGAGNAYGLCMYWANSEEYSDVSTVYSTSETNFSVWRGINVDFGYHY